MAFKSAIGNPLGKQIVNLTTAFPNVLSASINTVLSVVLPEGMWIVNVNDILATADNFAGNARINNFKQRILFGDVTRELTSLIGMTAVQMQLASIAIIKTDGITPVSVNLQISTTDNSTYSIDDGDVTFTQLY